jgi:hypothetical protein
MSERGPKSQSAVSGYWDWSVVGGKECVVICWPVAVMLSVMSEQLRMRMQYGRLSHG